MRVKNPKHSNYLLLEMTPRCPNAAKFLPYLDGGGGVQHVLQGKVAATVEVVFAEVLYELQVVQPIGQRHVLLQTDICGDRGGHQA